ncbi:MAG: radical SAM protein [Deltaproteobacteria bacterium]|nr:radical SAM protein [Deltaproteobacteria bacterium]
MTYDQPLFRPPSEADSLIFQVTLGCSNDTCRFCLMYKGKEFRVRSLDAIRRDVREMALEEPYARRVFLADGDALVARTSTLLSILELLRESFPRLERVSAYASPRNLIVKSTAELSQIRKAGLDLIYYGVESGDPATLDLVKKGATPDEMVKGCKKAHEAGMAISATVLLGLAGREGSARHVSGTVDVLNRIGPEYASALTLMMPFMDEYRRMMGGDWTPLNAVETLKEIRGLVAGIELAGCVFRTNHASNYLPLKGVLSKDRARLLKTLDEAIAHPTTYPLRPEWSRGL